SRRMKALWADPDYRARMAEALAGVERRKLTPEESARVAQIIAEKSRAMWQDQEKRQEIVAAISAAMASETVRRRLSELAGARWSDPAYRARYGADHFSEMAHALWEDPDVRDAHRRKIQVQRTDPAFRQAQSDGV